ncbi:hypothetical protein Bca4012_005636 [Brassica carinata]|uniref:Uncharacterized protein n=1 Tax=Brassica carinata TaxID=52824 RepID=A0A8X7RSN9_BRACI|nr:hypothetical protein Bca52824_040051 [Brassica carinata]
MLSLNPDSKKPSYIGTSPAQKSETVSKGPGIRITRSSGRWNFILQNFTSSSPIIDTGPTGGSPLPSGSDVASPMAAFLISSISADTPKADPEELIDSQASSLVICRDQTLPPIDDEPEANSYPLFISRNRGCYRRVKPRLGLREEILNRETRESE